MHCFKEMSTSQDINFIPLNVDRYIFALRAMSNFSQISIIKRHQREPGMTITARSSFANELVRFEKTADHPHLLLILVMPKAQAAAKT